MIYFVNNGQSNNIGVLKNLLCSTWQKTKPLDDINKLSNVIGRYRPNGASFLLPAACAFDQYTVYVPSDFDYNYISIFSNRYNGNNIITIMLSAAKNDLSNDFRMTINERCSYNIYYNDASNFITGTGNIILEKKNGSYIITDLTSYGILDCNSGSNSFPVVPIFQNYDFQSPDGSYHFNKNCELTDFNIQKITQGGKIWEN